MCYEILKYLDRYPQAEDTLEGIVEWWLLDQRIHQATIEARTALEDLVRQQLVLRRQGRDGRILYRLNAGKAQEIRDRIQTQAHGPASQSSQSATINMKSYG